MNDIQKKLDEFTAAIINEADVGSKEILEAIELQRKETIAAAEADIQQETSRYINAKFEEIKSRESRRISSAMMENRRALFLLRGEFADKVFDIVGEKVKKFTDSPEYGSHLKSLLDRAIKELGDTKAATVFLRDADMGFKEIVSETYNGVSLTFAKGSFILGGLLVSCPEKKLTIDMTFDAALKEQTGRFVEMFGLSLT